MKKARREHSSSLPFPKETPDLIVLSCHTPSLHPPSGRVERQRGEGELLLSQAFPKEKRLIGANHFSALGRADGSPDVQVDRFGIRFYRTVTIDRLDHAGVQ